jgi:hypothetical protein
MEGSTMDELDEYGAFNTRYEGVGRLQYSGNPWVPVSFELRQLVVNRTTPTEPGTNFIVILGSRSSEAT